MSSRERRFIHVHVLIRGRIGLGWYDVDRRLRLPSGTTLKELLAVADRDLPLVEALEHSPHLAHTLLLNGERCPVAVNGGRELADGDELSLLAPLAGG